MDQSYASSYLIKFYWVFRYVEFSYLYLGLAVLLLYTSCVLGWSLLVFIFYISFTINEIVYYLKKIMFALIGWHSSQRSIICLHFLDP